MGVVVVVAVAVVVVVLVMVVVVAVMILVVQAFCGLWAGGVAVQGLTDDVRTL